MKLKLNVVEGKFLAICCLVMSERLLKKQKNIAEVSQLGIHVCEAGEIGQDEIEVTEEDLAMVAGVLITTHDALCDQWNDDEHNLAETIYERCRLLVLSTCPEFQVESVNSFSA